MNRRILFLLVAASFFPAAAHALGIGRLHLESALNEPFEARIELLSPTREELDSLNVALANNEAFARAGIDRPFILSQLRFEIVEAEDGPDYIRVSSREPIREPFLNFLVEVSWSRGRLFREYTVLLDPPLYDPGVRSIAATPEPVRRAPAPAMPDAGDDRGYEAEATPTVTPSFTGTEYGPTVATDTLWSIASAVRPDAGISIQQMMLALVRANPEAFIDGNVNGLRRGVVLRIPDREEAASMSAEEALAEVRAQYAAWEGVREAAASAPAERPDTSTRTETAPSAPAATVAEESPELRLVAPGGNASATDAAPGAGSGNEAALRNDLALAQEQLQALSQENVDLKERLAETEAIVDDLKRLIALKDDELATLQRQAAGGAAPAETPAAPPAEAPAEAPAAEPEPVTKAEQPPAPKAPEAKPKAEPKKAAPPPPPPPPPEPTLVERVTGFVTGNLPLVGGSVLAVVLLAGGLAFAARRRRAAEEELDATGFDFGGAETELPGDLPDDGSEDITNVRDDLEQADAAGAAVAASPPASGARAAAQPASQEPAQAAPAEPEEDPLAEVNVFLAYEHFDQAEEFVRDAIAREPDNLDFHAKLLEVFYASGDRRKYEEAARVLHDKVGGSGPHWDNAVAMWSEMSPGRALFEAPAEGEEEAGPAHAGAGVLDLTAAADQPASMGLDFDLGEATAEPAAPAPATDEGILDLTAGNEEASRVSATAADEDILDVTAAVGLDTESPPAAAGGDDEEVLDITGGGDTGADDVLDVSSTGADDLLDVTAHSNVPDGELEGGDLLDVTAAAVRGTEEPAEEAPAAGADEHSLDFNLDLPAPAEPAEGSIDFEPAAAPAEEEGGLELDLSADVPAEPAGEEDGGLELDISGSDDDSSSGLELSLADDEEAPAEAPAAGGIELDLSTDDGAPDSGGLELELDTGDETPADEPDMEGTVEIPKLELDMDTGDGEDDDDDSRTVFVPRSADADEQTAEDEMATKLDLAKAYVELGDKESAKSILDEVISGGTDKQRQKAQELISQIS